MHVRHQADLNELKRQTNNYNSGAELGSWVSWASSPNHDETWAAYHDCLQASIRTATPDPLHRAIFGDISVWLPTAC